MGWGSLSRLAGIDGHLHLRCYIHPSRQKQLAVLKPQQPS